MGVRDLLWVFRSEADGRVGFYNEVFEPPSSFFLGACPMLVETVSREELVQEVKGTRREAWSQKMTAK